LKNKINFTTLDFFWNLERAYSFNTRQLFKKYLHALAQLAAAEGIETLSLTPLSYPQVHYFRGLKIVLPTCEIFRTKKI